MPKGSETHRRAATWVLRIYTLNAVVVAACLACFMLGFGILTDSIVAGLLFPVALLSMAREGSGWGLWMLSPLYCLPIALLARLSRRRPQAA
jgi:hypothetical protein